MSEELVKFQKSVELCNSRVVILEECKHYDAAASVKYPTLDEYKDIYYDTHGPGTFFFFLSFILAFIPTWFLIIPLFGKLSWHPFFKNGVPIVILIVLMFIILAILTELFHAAKKKVYDDYEQTVKEFEEVLPEIVAIRDEALGRLRNLEAYMRDENNCIIPSKYWHVANELWLLVQNKRAVDIVSAINKYEDIQHQTRLENMAAESLAYNEMAAYAAEVARQNSEVAAKKAGEAAFYSKVNLAYNVLSDMEEKK